MLLRVMVLLDTAISTNNIEYNTIKRNIRAILRRNSRNKISIQIIIIMNNNNNNSKTNKKH